MSTLLDASKKDVPKGFVPSLWSQTRKQLFQSACTEVHIPDTPDLFLVHSEEGLTEVPWEGCTVSIALICSQELVKDYGRDDRF